MLGLGLRHDCKKNCTSLNAVWKALYLYYGIQSSDDKRDVIRATNSGSPNIKGNLGHEDDPDCESQNVEHAVTKPKINKQCSQPDDLMETEEIKSQADLDPTRECSEQMNAIDTTVSFKLVLMMKLKIWS